MVRRVTKVKARDRSSVPDKVVKDSENPAVDKGRGDEEINTRDTEIRTGFESKG